MKEAVSGEPIEASKIPSHWEFPEKGKPGLKVTQIDLGESFLAFTLPDAPDYTGKNAYEGEHADYFFDKEGRPSASRRHSGLDTHIKLREKESEISLDIHEWGSAPECSEFSRISISEPDPNPQLSELTVENPIKRLAWVSYDYPLSNFHKFTHLNRLTIGCFGENFSVDRKGARINAPSSLLSLVRSKRDVPETFHWELSSLLTHKDNFLREEQKEPNEVFFRDKNGERNIIFKLIWEVQGGILIATQTHLPTQVSRTLRAPIILDMSKVAQAVFARPPYEKIKNRLSGAEELVVPWREIDRIMGVSLSYSRPVPKKAT